MRKKLLMGNWKMNKTISQTKDFLKNIDELVLLAKQKDIDIGIAPTYLSLQTLKDNTPNSLLVAAQNCHYLNNGAYTGEVSIEMLKEIGVYSCIIGHSERRKYDNETNEKCNLKILELLKNKCIPIYCVGETLEEFENNKTTDIVKEQLVVGLKDVNITDLSKIIIAYEPVWSIGTGKNASKEIAQNVCAFIRSLLEDLYSKNEADNVRILYGGSVKPNNISEYMKQKDIDGALVGGASLNVNSYIELIQNM